LSIQSPAKPKNPAAVALGSLGGRATAAKAERRAAVRIDSLSPEARAVVLALVEAQKRAEERPE
jgi:hypothetical protein